MWWSIFQPGFRGTKGFHERQPEVPPVASESMKITAKTAEKHCANELKYNSVSSNIGCSGHTSLFLHMHLYQSVHFHA